MTTDIIPAGKPSFEFGDRKLIVSGKPTFDQYKELCTRLNAATESIIFLIGDALNYAERDYGEGYSQLLDSEIFTCYNPRTLANIKSTFARWPAPRRVWRLPPSYYQETAYLPVSDANRIMDECAKDPAKKRNWIRQEKRRLGIKHLQGQNDERYWEMIDAIVGAIDALVEVYPPGLNEIEAHIKRIKHEQ